MRRNNNFSVSRRQLLMSAGALLILSGCSGQPAGIRPSNPAVFENLLKIPPLAEFQVDADGTRVFELEARPGSSDFLPGVQTPTWGYNGDFLGPTLRAERGQRIAIAVTNSLDEVTTVHWHGMHLPAAMDGGPHQVIAPGDTWRPTWEINQPAATLWYHPHPHGRTEEHVYRGLAGMFYVDDPSEAPALPNRYGVDDIPVVVQDKEFTDAGELTMGERQAEPGVLGSTVMTNGVIGAYFEVSTEMIRLRLLNGSTARTYDFGFEDNRNFDLVATDGGLLAEPYSTTRIRLSPAERAEIIVTLTPGDIAMLRSYPPELGDVASSFAFGGEDTFDVLQLRANDYLRPSSAVPAILHNHVRLQEADATVHREFTMAARMINGAQMDMNRIDEVVIEGTTEIWEIRSTDRLTHNFHIHDVQFYVLSIDGVAPPAELAGRKDTIYVEPGRRYRLIMQFGKYVDPEAAYMYHCHLLRHEDEGLMGQFVVVGTNDPQPSSLSGLNHQH